MIEESILKMFKFYANVPAKSLFIHKRMYTVYKNVLPYKIAIAIWIIFFYQIELFIFIGQWHYHTGHKAQYYDLKAFFRMLSSLPKSNMDSVDLREHT